MSDITKAWLILGISNYYVYILPLHLEQKNETSELCEGCLIVIVIDGETAVCMTEIKQY